MAFLPAADAKWIVGAEFCTGGSCTGWGAEETNGNFSPYQGDNTNCNQNVVNFGFAIMGDNNMCTAGHSYTCDSCNIPDHSLPYLP